MIISFEQLIEAIKDVIRSSIFTDAEKIEKIKSLIQEHKKNQQIQ